jgi:hypothetical protein
MPTLKSHRSPSPANPEIEPSELKAVREFLTSYRDEERRGRSLALPGGPSGPVVRNGITRARQRTTTKAAG